MVHAYQDAIEHGEAGLKRLNGCFQAHGFLLWIVLGGPLKDLASQVSMRVAIQLNVALTVGDKKGRLGLLKPWLSQHLFEQVWEDGFTTVVKGGTDGRKLVLTHLA